MTDSLVTYLHDHLARSTFAINLAKSSHDQHGDGSLGEMAAELLPELEAGRAVLEDLIGVARRVAARTGRTKPFASGTHGSYGFLPVIPQSQA
jgi:hypothetical protein